jgi:hypothetical protein
VSEQTEPAAASPPPPAGPPSAPPAEPPPATPYQPDSSAKPQKRGLSTKAVIWIIAVVVVVAIAGAGWFLSRSDPNNAKVGSCISGRSAENMKIVDCAGATAEHKVVGRVEGKTAEEFNTKLEEICQPFPTAETAFWEGKEGSGTKGYVLCLEPIKK